MKKHASPVLIAVLIKFTGRAGRGAPEWILQRHGHGSHQPIQQRGVPLQLFAAQPAAGRPHPLLQIQIHSIFFKNKNTYRG